MFSRGEDLRDFQSIPLRNAVLCVDCERVSSSRFDNCPVCGSYSVFSIGPALGGSRLLSEETAKRDGNAPRFDLEISIVLTQIDARSMSAAVEGLADAVRSKLGENGAFHVEVEPAGTMAKISQDAEYGAEAA